MILNNDAKRLLIYFFYDKDGIVDRYVSYILEDMKKNVADILFVSNVKIAEKSVPVVKAITKNILERENVGLDAWAYKEALEKVGWDKLQTYDEVILMNHTIMGPIYPFKEMFDTMNQKDLDFWGLTKFHKVKYDPFGIIECGYIPEHIQSHFIVVRKPLLMSSTFREYWEDLPEINSYEESIAFHETQFTRHFEKLDFSWDVYVNNDDLKGFCYCPIMYAIEKIIKEKRCPVFKRRSFFHNYDDILNNTAGEVSANLMKFLECNTDYDTNLIWENILRCCNMSQIKDCLQLNYVLPTKEIQTYQKNPTLMNKKIALIFHAYFKDLADSTYRYVNAMPKDSDIYITTDTQEKKSFFEKLFQNNKFNRFEVILVENRGRDVSALLVASKDFIMSYDYVCFAHDKKVGQLECGSVGASFAYQCLENVLCSETYVNNIIDLFEKNPRMGMLMPPPPIHGAYFPTCSDGWGPNFSNVENLIDQLELNVPVSENFSPVAPLGTMFWFRPKGIRKLFDYGWEYEDFPKEPNKIDGTILHAIERIYPLVMQDAGYYAAWCVTDDFASIMITNLNFMLSGIVGGLIKKGVRYTYHETQKIVEAQSSAINALQNANVNMQQLFPYLSNDANRGKMRIYYDIGAGFFEKDSVTFTADYAEKRLSCTMTIPSKINFIENLRFDPEEKGNILLENLEIIMEYDNGQRTFVDLSKCSTNGVFSKGKFIFVENDPQISWSPKEKQNIRKIHVSANINRKLTNTNLAKLLKKR